MSTTRKLMLLYALIPRDATRSAIDAPQITFDTAVFSWSGKRALTKEHAALLQNDILKTTRDIIEAAATSHTVVALGWKFDNVENKQRKIKINNTTSFQLLTTNKEKFAMIDDLLKAKESQDRKLSAIYQKTSPYEAMNILSGKSREFCQNENVIVIS